MGTRLGRCTDLCLTGLSRVAGRHGLVAGAHAGRWPGGPGFRAGFSPVRRCVVRGTKPAWCLCPLHGPSLAAGSGHGMGAARLRRRHPHPKPAPAAGAFRAAARRLVARCAVAGPALAPAWTAGWALAGCGKRPDCTGLAAGQQAPNGPSFAAGLWTAAGPAAYRDAPGLDAGAKSLWPDRFWQSMAGPCRRGQPALIGLVRAIAANALGHRYAATALASGPGLGRCGGLVHPTGRRKAFQTGTCRC